MIFINMNMYVTIISLKSAIFTAKNLLQFVFLFILTYVSSFFLVAFGQHVNIQALYKRLILIISSIPTMHKYCLCLDCFDLLLVKLLDHRMIQLELGLGKVEHTLCLINFEPTTFALSKTCEVIHSREVATRLCSYSIVVRILFDITKACIVAIHWFFEVLRGFANHKFLIPD